MTTEEFWAKYTGEEDIFDIFDDTCDFFSKELPDDFIEYYDVGEVILETVGHHESAKELDKVLKFIHILKNKQPKLYLEYFQYLDSFLIDYYCFLGDTEKAPKAFLNFMEYPVQDYDKFLLAFKQLLFYQYVDILNQAITKNFDIVVDSEDLMAGAEYDLAKTKFYLTLEDFYRANNREFDKVAFLEALDQYGFDFHEDFLLSIERGFYKSLDNIEDLKADFIQDRHKCLLVLKGNFFKYMSNKHFSFPRSGNLWDGMLEFLEDYNPDKKLNPDSYFSVKSNEFEKYLVEISGDIFLDNQSQMIAVLWGSVYIYDFLRSIGMISDETFDNFLYISRLLKGKVIGQYTPFLWRSNFVHVWEKPDCITNAEFVEEEKIFRKSFSFDNLEFSKLKEEISEELEEIGGLADFIVEGGKAKNNHGSSWIENVFGSSGEIESKDDSQYTEINTYDEPLIKGKKTGRNDPCPCNSGKKYKQCCGKK